MKKNIIYQLGVLLSFLLVFSSCEKWIDEEINVDPDSPADVSMDLLLPGIQAGMAYVPVSGNDFARETGFWMQYIDGTARQSQTESRYKVTNSTPNNGWTTIYDELFMDITILLAKAEENTSPHVSGVAKVLQANLLGITTDLWGDAPFAEAFQGNDNLTPAYDSQQDLYVKVQSLLDEAINHLNTAESTYGIEGDIIYGGDKEKWLKAAYALKARYALHLSKVDNNAYATALSHLDNAIDETANDLEFNFESAYPQSHPFYQFLEDRGDMVCGKFMVDLLQNNNDPRLPKYVAKNDDDLYVGSMAGSSVTTASLPGPYLYRADAPSTFISYVEMLFIKAEAQFKTGVAEADVRTTLKSAVAASLAKVEVSDATFTTNFATKVDALSGNDLFKEIMLQKYLGLYMQVETFNDFRRTDNVIGLQMAENAFTTSMPRRFVYPQSELDYNPQTVHSALVTDRVWWDQ